MSSSFIADPDKLLPPPAVRWHGWGDDKVLLQKAQAQYTSYVRQQHIKFRRNYDLGIVADKIYRAILPSIEVTIQRLGDQEIIDVLITSQGRDELLDFKPIVAIEFVWGAGFEGNASAVFRKSSTEAFWGQHMFNYLWYTGGGNKHVFVFNLEELAQAGVDLPLEVAFFPDYSNYPYNYYELGAVKFYGSVSGDFTEDHDGFIADKIGTNPAYPATITEPRRITNYPNQLPGLWSQDGDWATSFYDDNTPQTLINNMFSGPAFQHYRLKSYMDVKIASVSGTTVLYDDNHIINVLPAGVDYLGRPHNTTVIVTRIEAVYSDVFYCYGFETFDYPPLPFNIKRLTIDRWEAVKAVMGGTYADDAEFDAAYNELGWSSKSGGTINMGDPKLVYPAGDEGYTTRSSPARFVITPTQFYGASATAQFSIDYSGVAKTAETQVSANELYNGQVIDWPPDGWDL